MSDEQDNSNVVNLEQARFDRELEQDIDMFDEDARECVEEFLALILDKYNDGEETIDPDDDQVFEQRMRWVVALLRLMAHQLVPNTPGPDDLDQLHGRVLTLVDTLFENTLDQLCEGVPREQVEITPGNQTVQTTVDQLVQSILDKPEPDE